MILTKEQQKEFEEKARPLMKWLSENTDPHCKAILSYANTELLQASVFFPYDDQNRDIDLCTVLSNRSRNALKRGIGCDKEIYISDIVKFIKENGDECVLLRFRDLGKKSYEEIMTYVRPFLNDL